MRLTPASLQGRMLMLSAVATLLALALAGWAIVGVLERFVTEGLDRRLDAELALLASTVGPDGSVDRDRLARRIGALEAGPGWRWRIVGPGGALGSADFTPVEAGPPRPPGAPMGPPPGPPSAPPVPRDDARGAIAAVEGREQDGGRVHARQLVLSTTRGAVTLTAAAPRDVVRSPITAALVPLLAALAVLAVLLVGAALVQLRLGLRPVRRMRDQVAALRNGRLRAVEEDQPSELRPLAVELNALVRDNEAALAAARLSAANLAHALKTPVATLALDVRGEPARAAQVARIDATIRHHLGRARAMAANQRAATALAPAIAGVVDAIRRLHADKGVAFEIAASTDIRVAVDANDLDELLGNLIDNAARYARGAVRVAAMVDPADPRRIAISVEDDGPGIPAAARGNMPSAGMRLDEAAGGHGFGLAIVGELVALYGGALTLGEAEAGGLSARFSLPRND